MISPFTKTHKLSFRQCHRPTDVSPSIFRCLPVQFLMSRPFSIFRCLPVHFQTPPCSISMSPRPFSDVSPSIFRCLPVQFLMSPRPFSVFMSLFFCIHSCSLVCFIYTRKKVLPKSIPFVNLMDSHGCPSSSQTSFWSQITSSSDTLLASKDDQSVACDKYNSSQKDESSESEDDRPRLDTKCAIQGAILRQPMNILNFYLDSEHITGFTMYQVVDTEEMIIPASDSDSAVAVIQGTDIGYFSSWTEALPHVRVFGVVYSFHSSLYDAQLCFMRALLKNKVCFIYGDDILEAAVTPVIPDGMGVDSWWFLFWSFLGGSIPTIDPEPIDLDVSKIPPLV
ncbi:hypothetical protein D9757_014534 [Collybiopsis confluens]|uniref:Uncharacterized protein n=1 Tax=Collybiopsis confluens TaxID=2823264 RepID=A0A8H5FNV9_9AGAR|nr:hypothetical protein D9757_014534 [Collybiopsis confluens]